LKGIAQLLQITKNMSHSFTDIYDLNQNISDILYNISLAYQHSALVLHDVVGTLSSIKDTGTSTAGTVNDILLAIEDILDIYNQSSLLNNVQPGSCKDINSLHPNSSSGYYHINGEYVYCSMDHLCGGSGRWTRIAYLDMSDATVNCPSNFTLYQSGTVRACGRQTSSGSSCSSVKYGTNGITYSVICGRLVGYQFASPNAVDNIISPTLDINSYYVDGVNITRGSPRQHVWTHTCVVILIRSMTILIVLVMIHLLLTAKPSHHLLVLITSVNQVIMDLTGLLFYTPMILCGMAKGVVLLKDHVVLLQANHGSTGTIVT
jgi:hypothetical protein